MRAALIDQHNGTGGLMERVVRSTSMRLRALPTAATALARCQAAPSATHMVLQQQQPPLLSALSSTSNGRQRTRGFATGNLLQPRLADSNVRRTPETYDADIAGSLCFEGVDGVHAVADADGSGDDVLKNAIVAPTNSFDEAYRAYEELRSHQLPLREKHYLSLVYKACRESRYADVKSVFDAFIVAEASGDVILPPRADRTWNYLTFERMQLLRFVLWSMLDSKKYRQMNAVYREYVHNRPNKWSLFESDPLNFLLRMECTGRFADEEDLESKLRVDKILQKMEMWRFNASYSSSHALFRYLLYHPDVFIKQELVREGKDVATKPSELTLGGVLVRYFGRFTKALRRDPKRISIAVSAAAAAGQHDVVKAILKDAERHTIRVDAVSFAHAVECAENEEKRMEIVELYVKAKERNAIYTTQDEPASISNYLLLYAIFDGNFRHMMELLHEMQLYNNAASNKTTEELFQSVAKYRAQIRHDHPDDATKLNECPTIEALLNNFPNVIPRNVHTITQGILQSLRSGDLLIALKLVRGTVRTTDIVLRREVYAQLAYPMLARGTAQYDELELLELERYYDIQHPKERVYLNAQVLNLCESNADFVATLACLDRWQLQRHAPLSRRSLQRVFDIVSKQLQQLRQQDSAKAEFLVEGMELSFLAFLKRYHDIIPFDAWTFGNAIIRSGTNGLHADLLILLKQAHDEGFVLEKAAYKIAFEVLDSMQLKDEIVNCATHLKENGAWKSLVEKSAALEEMASRAASS
ncbi:hypothetical protein FI667_g621, partial [Globisporangium splendens]